MNFLKIMIFFVWFYASCLIAARVSTMSLRELKIRIRFCQAQVCFRTNSTANLTLSHFQTCNKCAKALKHGSTTPKYKRVRWIKSKSDSNGRACALIVHFNSKVNSIFQVCLRLFELPKCCKHKSYKANGFFQTFTVCFIIGVSILDSLDLRPMISISYKKIHMIYFKENKTSINVNMTKSDLS